MIYTAWGDWTGGGFAHTLVPGTSPRFHDGTPMPDCTRLVYTIEADSWDEAVAKFDELRGWNQPKRKAESTES
jgi:hypothetical protein